MVTQLVGGDFWTTFGLLRPPGWGWPSSRVSSQSGLVSRSPWSRFSLGLSEATFLASTPLPGSISFFLPFLGALAFAYFVTHWNVRAAEIAGIALSTTSVAVVYSVMVETGLNKAELGKLILAACFVTDLGTVIALGVLFAS